MLQSRSPAKSAAWFARERYTSTAASKPSIKRATATDQRWREFASTQLQGYTCLLPPDANSTAALPSSVDDAAPDDAAGSTTSTLKVQVALLPELSVALMLTMARGSLL